MNRQIGQTYHHPAASCTSNVYRLSGTDERESRRHFPPSAAKCTSAATEYLGSMNGSVGVELAALELHLQHLQKSDIGYFASILRIWKVCFNKKRSQHGISGSLQSWIPAQNAKAENEQLQVPSSWCLLLGTWCAAFWFSVLSAFGKRDGATSHTSSY